MIKESVKKLITIAVKNKAISIVVCTAIIGAGVTGGAIVYNNKVNSGNEYVQAETGKVEDGENKFNLSEEVENEKEVVEEINAVSLEDNIQSSVEENTRNNKVVSNSKKNNKVLSNNKINNSVDAVVNINTLNNESNNTNITNDNSTNTNNNEIVNDDTVNTEVKDSTQEVKPAVIIKEAGYDPELSERATKLLLDNHLVAGATYRDWLTFENGQDIMDAQLNYLINNDTEVPEIMKTGTIGLLQEKLYYRREKRVSLTLSANCNDEELFYAAQSGYIDSNITTMSPQCYKCLKVEHDGTGQIILTVLSVEYGWSPFQ